VGKHSAAVPPQRPAGVVVVVALVLGLALAGGLYFLLRQTDDDAGPVAPRGAASSTGGVTTGSSCAAAGETVRVAVAPGIAPVVEAAADRVTAQNACLTFAVTPAASAAVAAAFASGKDAPTAWVSDARVFVDAVRAAKPDAVQADVHELATSPLVFAVPATVAAKAGPALAGASWSALATGDGSIPVRLPDPETTTSGRLVLLSAPTALGDSPATRIALGRTLLGWSHSSMPAEADLFAAAGTDQAAVFPTSEQAVAADLRQNPGQVVAVVPKEGTGRYDYSLVTAAGAPQPAVDALSALRQQLTNDDGRVALTTAGFRLPGAEGSGPGVPGMPSGGVKYLPNPSAVQQAALVKTWTGVKTDARMLALIDTSGSMKEREGDKTRMVLAGEAAQTAITIFPNTSQLGLWTFGVDKGGPGQDWREIVPIRQLDEGIAGKPQRQLLGEALPALVTSASGGTGLYDTLLAAYERMTSSYVPGRVNSVILLTDGRNEDPNGITLEQLIARINALKDPAKPVVIVTVGMGQGVDTAELAAVSAVTGGKTYVAQNPQDIRQVFIDALLSRDCTGSTCTSR
jgi:Ca-activated chloride channel family protein